MNARVAKVGFACRVGPYFIADPLELSLPDRGKVFTLRTGGGLFVKVDRNGQFLPHPLAALTSKPNAVLHCHSLNRDEGDDVGCTHPRVLSSMVVQIYQLSRGCGARKGRIDGPFRLSHERYHGSVMVWVRFTI